MVSVLILLALVAAACSSGTETGATAERVDDGAEETAATTATGPAETTLVIEPEVVAEPRVDPVPGVLASLSTEEKIGQLLMPTLFGQGATVSGNDATLNQAAHGAADPTDIVAQHHLGGIIYLEDNIDSAQQVRAMSRELQDAALADSGIGLLVAVDQEGGRVSRLSDEMSLFPPAQTMAGDAELVRETNYVTGQQVQQQGVNVVLAPVADVIDPASPSFINDRSFGADPAVVATMVGAAVDGLQ
ncbi:MAG: glycoside hydrolase family 3 N-terminal domain-containing protein, partial [Actinomycetota bacterium]